MANDKGKTHATGEEETLIQAHLVALAWIEAHLLEPMTVKSIADHANQRLESSLGNDFHRLPGGYSGHDGCAE